MRIRTSFLALPVALLVAVAGCSSDGESDPTESATSEATVEATQEATEEVTQEVTAEEATAQATQDAASANGEMVTGTGYSYALPEGWVSDSSINAAADSAAYDPNATTFASNINVIVSPGEVGAQVHEDSVSSLVEMGATDAAVQDRVMVGGVESAHLAGTVDSNGESISLHQFAPAYDGSTYITTITFASDLSEGERQAIIDTILGSWTWS